MKKQIIKPKTIAGMKKVMLAVVALVATITGSAQTANDVNTNYNEAAELLQAKSFAAAVPLLVEVVEMGETV